MTTTSVYWQESTYPNKPIRIISGFALGGSAYSAARILDSESGEKIGQSTTREPLLFKPECELWGMLFDIINLRAQ